jgi:SH3 domain-containing protein
MTTRSRVVVAVSAAILCEHLACGAFAAEARQGSQRWIHGSWVNVRSGPAKDAKVLGNWTTNTKLELLKQEGDWCQLRAADGLTGYVACNLVGAKRLELDDLDFNKSADAWARAFWILPSFRRFEEFGIQLSYGMLTEEQRKREEETQKPIRFPVPEFEGMKRRLLQGILPDFENAAPRVEAFAQDAPRVQVWWMGETLTYLRGFLKPEMLREPKPSLFAKASDVLIFAESTTDGVAAQFDRPSTARPIGVPRYEANHYDAGIAGIWDIGGIEVRYPAATVLHAIARNGLVGARSIETARLDGLRFADSCATGYAPLPTGNPLDGYPRVKERLVAFYALKPIEARKVQVVTSKARAFIHVDPHSGPPQPAWRDLLVHHIDLNNDGAPDIAVIEGRLYQSPSGEQVSWFYYFVNIAGTWWLAGFDEYVECTGG